MSLVAGPSLGILDRHLQVAGEQGFVPYEQALKPFLREGEAAERYRSLADWRKQRGHFWVGDGPFYLHSVHPVESTAVLRRFEHFPDPADKWLRFTRPEIPELALDGPMVVEAGRPAEFSLQITFEGKPYPSDAIDTVQYLLFDSAGELAVKGRAEYMDDGVWRIRPSEEQLAELAIGANSLELAVTSKRVALPSFASHAFAMIPSRKTADGGGAP